jgi:hypothetical protein
VVGHQLDGSLPDGSTSAYLAIAYEPVWRSEPDARLRWPTWGKSTVSSESG